MIKKTSFPPPAIEVIREIASDAQMQILEPLYAAESQANMQGTEEVRESISGLIYSILNEWKLLY